MTSATSSYPAASTPDPSVHDAPRTPPQLPFIAQELEAIGEKLLHGIVAEILRDVAGVVQSLHLSGVRQELTNWANSIFAAIEALIRDLEALAAKVQAILDALDLPQLHADFVAMFAVLTSTNWLHAFDVVNAIIAIQHFFHQAVTWTLTAIQNLMALVGITINLFPGWATNIRTVFAVAELIAAWNTWVAAMQSINWTNWELLPDFKDAIHYTVTFVQAIFHWGRDVILNITGFDMSLVTEAFEQEELKLAFSTYVANLNSIDWTIWEAVPDFKDAVHYTVEFVHDLLHWFRDVWFNFTGINLSLIVQVFDWPDLTGAWSTFKTSVEAINWLSEPAGIEDFTSDVVTLFKAIGNWILTVFGNLVTYERDVVHNVFISFENFVNNWIRYKFGPTALADWQAALDWISGISNSAPIDAIKMAYNKFKDFVDMLGAVTGLGTGFPVLPDIADIPLLAPIWDLISNLLSSLGLSDWTSFQSWLAGVEADASGAAGNFASLFSDTARTDITDFTGWLNTNIGNIGPTITSITDLFDGAGLGGLSFSAAGSALASLINTASTDASGAASNFRTLLSTTGTTAASDLGALINSLTGGGAPSISGLLSFLGLSDIPSLGGFINLIEGNRLHVVPAAHISAINPELLLNPGFDTAESIGSSPGVAWDGSVGRTALGSAKIVASGSLIPFWSGPIAVAQGDEIAMSIWANWSSLTTSGSSPAPIAVYLVEYYQGVAGTSNLVDAVASPGSSSSGWTQLVGQVSGSNYVVPSGVDTIYMVPRVDTTATGGTVWFDDGSVTKVGVLGGSHNLVTAFTGVVSNAQGIVDGIANGLGITGTGHLTSAVQGFLEAIPNANITSILGGSNLGADVQAFLDHVANGLGFTGTGHTLGNLLTYLGQIPPANITAILGGTNLGADVQAILDNIANGLGQHGTGHTLANIQAFLGAINPLNITSTLGLSTLGSDLQGILDHIANGLGFTGTGHTLSNLLTYLAQIPAGNITAIFGSANLGADLQAVVDHIVNGLGVVGTGHSLANLLSSLGAVPAANVTATLGSANLGADVQAIVDNVANALGNTGTGHTLANLQSFLGSIPSGNIGAALGSANLGADVQAIVDRVANGLGVTGTGHTLTNLQSYLGSIPPANIGAALGSANLGADVQAIVDKIANATGHIGTGHTLGNVVTYLSAIPSANIGNVLGSSSLGADVQGIVDTFHNGINNVSTASNPLSTIGSDVQGFLTGLVNGFNNTSVSSASYSDAAHAATSVSNTFGSHASTLAQHGSVLPSLYGAGTNGTNTSVNVASNGLSGFTSGSGPASSNYYYATAAVTDIYAVTASWSSPPPSGGFYYIIGRWNGSTSYIYLKIGATTWSVVDTVSGTLASGSSTFVPNNQYQLNIGNLGNSGVSSQVGYIVPGVATTSFVTSSVTSGSGHRYGGVGSSSSLPGSLTSFSIADNGPHQGPAWSSLSSLVSTTATTYGPIGNAVTTVVGSSGCVLVGSAVTMANGTSGAGSFLSWAASGANSITATDTYALSTNSNLNVTIGRTDLITGLTAGSTQFFHEARAGSGTHESTNHMLWVVPL